MRQILNIFVALSKKKKKIWLLMKISATITSADVLIFNVFFFQYFEEKIGCH